MKKVFYVEKYLSKGTSRLSFKFIEIKSRTKELQFKSRNWNYFDNTSKKIKKWKKIEDFFSSRMLMIFHSFTIIFFSSSSRRFNCFLNCCNFAFVSRISFRTRILFLCTLRIMKKEIIKSQVLFDATHERHFFEVFLNIHRLNEKKQGLQRRMLTNNTSKFEKKNCFR